MEGILREVATLNRVVGAFVCDASGDLLAVEPRDLAGAREAARVGRSLAGLGGSGDAAPGEVELCFENGRVLLRPAGLEASLGVVCEPNVDTALVGPRVAEAAAWIAGKLESTRSQRAEVDRGALVRSVLEESLGRRAEKPLALVAAAGSSPEKLAAAGAEAVKFAKLFLGKDRAEALRARLSEILGPVHQGGDG